MPAAIANRIVDRTFVHALQLAGFEHTLQRRTTRILRQLERDLIRQLELRDPTRPRLTRFRQQRLTRLLQATDVTIRSAYEELPKAVEPSYLRLAELEWQFVTNSTNRLGKSQLFTIGPSESQLTAIAGRHLITGTPQRDWWRGQDRQTRARFHQEMRLGILQGDPITAMSRRVRLKVMSVSRTWADTVVRGSVQSVANTAREALYDAHSDIMRGRQALVTLDKRTSEICIVLSGAAWGFDGEPLPDSPVQGRRYPGPPPWHHKCRSTIIAILKDIAEIIGVRGPEFRPPPAATRASMDGQVAAKTTYAQWLRRKERAQTGFARDILGPAKYTAWKAGELDLGELVNASLKPRTLADLEIEAA